MVRPLFLLLLIAAAPLAAEDLLVRLLQAQAEQRQALLSEHFRASQVRWSAGETSLIEGIRHLSGNEANVLLELGINEGERVQVAAFSGDWWQGVLQICDTFQLEPVPIGETAITRSSGPHYELDAEDESNQLQSVLGGSLLLRPRHQMGLDGRPTAPCGPVLIEFTDTTLTEIRRLKGSARSIDLSWQVRLEPGLRHDLVKHVHLQWTAAKDQNGDELKLPTKEQEEDVLLRSLRGRPDQDSPRILAYDPYDEQPIYPATSSARVTELKSGSQRIILSGTLTLTCQTILTASTEIALDEEATFENCPVPIRCTLRQSPNGRIRKRFPHQLDLTYRSDDLPTPPQITVLGPDGIELDSFARNHESQDDESVITMYLSNVAPGKHRVNIRTAIALGEVVIPVDCEIQLP